MSLVSKQRRARYRREWMARELSDIQDFPCSLTFQGWKEMHGVRFVGPAPTRRAAWDKTVTANDRKRLRRQRRGK